MHSVHNQASLEPLGQLWCLPRERAQRSIRETLELFGRIQRLWREQSAELVALHPVVGKTVCAQRSYWANVDLFG